MLRTLDRYIIRQVMPPFFLALVVFTFVLQIQPIMDYAEKYLAKGVAWPTIGQILLTLLPQALGVTIPMALLAGLLIALSRLSGDRETVALLACGVSLHQLLRPVALVSTTAAAITTYILIVAIPDANQAFREITYEIVSARAESDVRPRVFFEDFPNRVLYVRDVPASGGWGAVFLADTSQPGRPVVFVAARGRLALDRQAQKVDILLEEVSRHSVAGKAGNQPETERSQWMRMSLDPHSVFPSTPPVRAASEMRIRELQKVVAEKQSAGISAHPEIMQIHQKFSIPAACLVFGLIGLALGVTVRKEGKLAGFAVAIGVIFLYYVVMYFAESLAKGQLMPAWLARWVPNIVLGTAGVAAFMWRARHAEGRFPIPLPRLGRRPASHDEAVLESPAPARASAPRVVVVIRFPRIWFPRPTVLDRYVMLLYLRIVGLAFLALLGIFYISTFIDLSDKLFKGQATGWMLARYLWYATPQFIYYIVPISALVAVLVTVGALTKNSELAVMKACGISLYRVAAPLLMLASAWSLVLFALEERVLAKSNIRAEALNTTIRGRAPRTFNVLNRKWVAGKEGNIYHYTVFDPQRDVLSGLSVYQFTQHGWGLARQTFAERAEYGAARWQALNGWIAEFDRGNATSWRAFAAHPLNLEAPEYFETEAPDAELMTYAELSRYITDLRASGFDVAQDAVALHRKLSFPFVTIVMTLLAVPFAVTTGRRGALYGIGLGIVLAIAYWMLLSVFAAIGSAGLLQPVLAAWAPNVLFAGAALYLILTVRT